MPDRELFDILQCDRPMQIADVGAALLGEEPPYKPLVDLGIAELNAFDADPRQHQPLRALYGERVRIHPQIIGAGGPATLHVAAQASGMTSLLRPSAEHLAFFNDFERLGRLEAEQAVTTTRLDDVPGLPDLDFLKMDIQGGELAALQSGQKRLARCAMVQLEVSFVPLYEGQPTFGEVDVWMRGQGFLPHCFTGVKRWSVAPVLRNNDARTPFNQLLEADIVYVRDTVRPETLDSGMAKAIALFAHYGYLSIDLAGRMIVVLMSRGELAGDAFDRYLAFVNAAG